MDTEMSKLEKGEDSHLLSDHLVKPVLTAGGGGANKLYHKKKSFSLFRCLCWILAILAVLLLLTIVLVATGALFWARYEVKRFTVKGAQSTLPILQIPAGDLEIIKDEAKLFWDQLRMDVTPQKDLVITEADMNGLIASSNYLRGHALVTISKDKWETELVLPTDKLPGGKGRYFVGRSIVETSEADQGEASNIVTQLTPKHAIQGLNFERILSGKYLVYSSDNNNNNENKKLTMELEYGQFLNWIAPDDWIARHENLLDCDYYDDHGDNFDKHDCQEIIKTLARLERISILDKKIVFTPIRSSSTYTGEKTAIEEEEEEGSIVDSTQHHGGIRRRLMSQDAPLPSMMRSGPLIRRVLRNIF